MLCFFFLFSFILPMFCTFWVKTPNSQNLLCVMSFFRLRRQRLQDEAVYFTVVHPAVCCLLTYGNVCAWVCDSVFQPLYLRNMWTYFNRTHHNFSLPRPLDTDDIFKIMCRGSRSGRDGYRNLIKLSSSRTAEGIRTQTYTNTYYIWEMN